VLFDGSVEMTWAGNTPWAAEMRCGGPQPQDGWICRSLGVADPAPRVTLRGRSIDGRTVLRAVFNVRGRVAPMPIGSAADIVSEFTRAHSLPASEDPLSPPHAR
jgi:hypothetical protein